jgi:hypothetical protein
MILRRTESLSLTRRSCLGKKQSLKKNPCLEFIANQLEGFSSPGNQKKLFYLDGEPVVIT